MAPNITKEYVDFEKVNQDRRFTEEFEWMIRPCSLYRREYKECSRFKARFDQYYKNGEFTDCSQFQKDKDNCEKFTKRSNYAAGVEVIKSEKSRMAKRLKAHYGNDVWTLREERPPPNWNAPLPDHLEERRRKNYLVDKAEELEKPFMLEGAPWSCVIS